MLTPLCDFDEEWGFIFGNVLWKMFTFIGIFMIFMLSKVFVNIRIV